MRGLVRTRSRRRPGRAALRRILGRILGRAGGRALCRVLGRLRQRRPLLLRRRDLLTTGRRRCLARRGLVLVLRRPQPSCLVVGTARGPLAPVVRRLLGRRRRTTRPLTALGRELLRRRLTTFRTARRAIGAPGRWRSAFAPGTACTLGRYTRLSFQRAPNPRCSTT
ncbi:hypothetical protein C791_1495 [Amycolatopsis azurea DSM 43854]|uniref:Uncharacterized protein n=1 Tax=Amycolatopsis azurea DSM 43854 TaxID=1238180 RepID=M2PTY3_9PSEU|nr:hypothetical protein C791_1495 [Amycolatopsis azurea DSM 43854]